MEWSLKKRELKVATPKKKLVRIDNNHTYEFETEEKKEDRNDISSRI